MSKARLWPGARQNFARWLRVALYFRFSFFSNLSGLNDGLILTF
jgi:hypothetical protein